MLLVFSDDWGRHPSSCQHLVAQLVERHRVTWVNTIGMRPPRVNLATLRRGWEKITQWSRKSSAKTVSPTNPTIINPRMWPWFTRSTDRWLNQRLLLPALQKVVAAAEEPIHAITTIPIVADLMRSLSVESWTYYCVDDFSVWPGLDQATMQRMEQQVIAQSDTLIAASENLACRLRERRDEVKLLTHGVDLAFWQGGAGSHLPENLQQLAAPLIVFWGVVDRRMDASWIARLAGDLEQATLLLVGPLDDPDPQLFNHPRVVYSPALSLKQLPALGQRADVLIMPYADLPVTRAMQPLKLKEYLATGKPVVVSDLPANRPWSDCLDVARTAEEFSALVRARLQTGATAEQMIARQRIADESWQAKAEQFEAWVTGAPRCERALSSCDSRQPLESPLC